MTKQPYLTINIIGLLLAVMCFFSEQLAEYGFWLVFAAVMYSALGVCLLILLAINICAFYAVKNDKSVLGVLLSLPFGSPGAFIAVNTCNTGYKRDKAIKIIFNIHVWIVVWIAVSFLLFLSGFHDLIIVGF